MCTGTVVTGEPPPGGPVELVVGPRERQQDVDIEQGVGHSTPSWASSSDAREPGIRSDPAATENTGRPSMASVSTSE